MSSVDLIELGENVLDVVAQAQHDPSCDFIDSDLLQESSDVDDTSSWATAFNNLSLIDRGFLKVGRLNAAMSIIANDELHRHPWKLFFYVPTPFPMPPPGRMIGFITLNVIYNSVARTEKAKWARSLVKASWREEPCMTASAQFLKITRSGKVSVRKAKVLSTMWRDFSSNVGDAALYHWNRWGKSSAIEKGFSDFAKAVRSAFPSKATDDTREERKQIKQEIRQLRKERKEAAFQNKMQKRREKFGL